MDLPTTGGKWKKKESQKKLIRRYFSTSNEFEAENAEFSFVSYEDILSATKHFADSNLLGWGGFGKVYKVKESSTYSRTCF
jgi:hypothetical protein